jgi:hypothetical protein
MANIIAVRNDERLLFFKVILLRLLLVLYNSIEYGKVRRASATLVEATRLPSYEPVFVQHEVDSRGLSDRDSTLASIYGHEVQKSYLVLVRNPNELWILPPVGAGLRGPWNAV